MALLPVGPAIATAAEDKPTRPKLSNLEAENQG
jgi:hypothetical protein